MTTERRSIQPEDDADDSLGVLDSTGAIGTADIGLLGDATAQVLVTLPSLEDDDLVDDDVVDGEAHNDLVLDADPAALVREDDGIGRIHEGFDVADIVIEIPAGADDAVVVAELVEDGTDPDRTDDEPEALGSAADGPEDGTDDDTARPQAATWSAHPETGFHDEAEPATAKAPAEPAEGSEEPAIRAEDVDDTADEDRDDAADEDPDDVAEELEDVRFPGSGTDVQASDDEAVDVPSEREHAPAEVAEPEPSPARDADVVDAPAFAPVLAVHTAPVAAVEEETVSHEPARTPDPELVSRRLDQFADRERESADLLTADRLLDPSQLTRPEPEGVWSHLLYTVSGRRINIGDGKRARERKALNARIAAPLSGTARFVPVLSRKGGVGKTTVTALLGMALADAREDRVIAVDANPDRGTLADRIARTNSKTVRDLVRIHEQVTGYHDISAVVSRDGTRLDVLASDADPRVSEAFSDVDYEQVASVAAHYYSLVLTDTGTGIVHSVMGATLDRADTIVVVAGLSVDEARLASETLTWLETNGYGDKVRDAVVVLNQSTPGAPMVRLDELEAHFRTRVAHVLRIPYDTQIAAGSAITYSALQPETRQAARELAAIVVEGLRAQAA
ncbi:MinD/ParA family ATP-binding protein [Microbacterium sp. 22242]|uniref:MinD/ParA family ATP-binding protein n=1 Tax=Microbacterium sp. 22242 TaxID=3453896 RepID=UPI003F83F28C